MPVYWTGPSIGFDAGGDGARVFTLVYHLDDSADCSAAIRAARATPMSSAASPRRTTSATASSSVPIKLGVGLRLGVNAGWVNYTRESRLAPF